MERHPSRPRPEHPWLLGALIASCASLSCTSDVPDEEHAPLGLRSAGPGDISAPRSAELPWQTYVPDGLTPIFQCVAPNANEGLTAVFGYLNETGEQVGVAVGDTNFIDTPYNDRGQSVVFEPGYHHAVFAVEFGGADWVAWQLGEETAFADRYAWPCPEETAELTIASDVPPLPWPPPAANPVSPPALAGEGDPRQRAEDFVTWFGRSTVDQLVEAQSEMAAASEDYAITYELIRIAEENRDIDWVRSLLAITVLGELRNPDAWGYLRWLAEQTPPEGPTTDHGDDPERTRMIMLQLKAVAGLGYWRTPQSDEVLLGLMNAAPTPEIRCEAARTYRYHHDDDALADARNALPEAERWCLDVIDNAIPAQEFDQSVIEFRAVHPELSPQSETRRQ
jgi:hypothetical protein